MMDIESQEEIGQAIAAYFEALNSGLCPVCNQPVQEEIQNGRCVYARPCGHRMFQGRARKRKENPTMINNDLVRWRYIRPGDMLEARTRNGEVLNVGPVLAVEYRTDKDNHYAPEKKYVLVPSLKNTEKRIDIPLKSVQAVYRNGQEVIRFTENEQQEVGCATCGQRKINQGIPGHQFCSLHCQQEWTERYYQDYPPGTNPIERSEPIHTANCDECRKLNRVYCPNCVG